MAGSRPLVRKRKRRPCPDRPIGVRAARGALRARGFAPFAVAESGRFMADGESVEALPSGAAPEAGGAMRGPSRGSVGPSTGALVSQLRGFEADSVKAVSRLAVEENSSRMRVRFGCHRDGRSARVIAGFQWERSRLARATLRPSSTIPIRPPSEAEPGTGSASRTGLPDRMSSGEWAGCEGPAPSGVGLGCTLDQRTPAGVRNTIGAHAGRRPFELKGRAVASAPPTVPVVWD